MRYSKMKSFSVCSFLLVFLNFLTFFSNGQAENIAINPLKETSQSFVRNFMLEFSKSNQSLTTCILDLIHWYNAISKMESWSLQMLDSWGKIPVGVLNGNAFNLGNYDECINSIESEQRKIKGKYCLVELPFDMKVISKQPNTLKLNNIQNLDEIETIVAITKHKRKGNNLLVYTNGICIPHTCKSVEMENIFQVILKVQNLTNVKVIIDQDYCVTNDAIVWRTVDWIAFGLFSFIGILMLSSTLYEFVIKYCCEKENNSDRLHKLLTSFSITTNTIKVISPSGNSENLNFLNGLRAISIMLVIITHRFISIYVTPATNLTDFAKFISTNVGGIIGSVHLVVDTFFVVGGFLISFLQLKKTDKAKNFNVLSFYFHRIIRITPALTAALLFFTTLMRYVGSGPVWNKSIQIFISHCERDWWYTLLYIQNYVGKNFCMPHLWYSSVDMQLYILSPILIYAFLINKKMGWTNIILWMLALQITLIVIVFENKWNAGFFATLSIITNRLKDFYYPTHTRALPWLIGFCLGCFLTGKSRNAIKMNKFTVVIIWISCLAIITSIICVMKPLQSDNHEITHLTDSMYNAFAKNIWALCIAWIIFACYFGYGGPIDKFLSLSIWEIIGKLSFSMYLTHPIVIILDVTSKNSEYWSIFGSLTESFCDIILTLMVSYLLTVSIELPFSNIGQVLFPKKKAKTETGLINLTTIK